ncbi:MAG: LuxR C-terminal-related transcriptional regulator [Jatrophihabitantaceae bacterium]
MRIVICARPRLFAESLAWCLRQQGDTVLGVVSHLPAARESVTRYRPDVLLTDQVPQWGEDVAVMMLPADAVRSPADDRTTPSGTVLASSTTLAQIVAQLRRVEVGRARRTRAPLRAAPPGRTWAPSSSRHLAGFLTGREREVLGELVLGSDTATVARRLRICRTTARDHVQSALTKMGAHTRIELVSMAVRDGLVDPATGAWLDATG